MFFFFDDETHEMIPSQHSEATFEDIKHVDEYGEEFWYARELQKVLEYRKWENFQNVIDKAKVACKNAGNIEKNHFPEVRKMVPSGVADVPIKDYKLTRYACYLTDIL